MITFEEAEAVERTEAEYNHSKVIKTALNLARYFGWLEVLDYYETIHGLEAANDQTMRLAILGDQILVVEWLLAR
ncbi:MAG: hypothetical protein Q9214_004313, partial [Letrouitia sp. 1 TL-2023]